MENFWAIAKEELDVADGRRAERATTWDLFLCSLAPSCTSPPTPKARQTCWPGPGAKRGSLGPLPLLPCSNHSHLWVKTPLF